jgi:hypothetical protein
MWTDFLGHNCQRRGGDRKVVANFMRWRESGGVSFKISKLKRKKKKIFRLQTPLITSWFREKNWLNAANSAFSKSLQTIVGGQKHFLKGSMCRPLFFLLLLLLGLIFKRHLAKITCPGHYRYTNVVDIHL